MLSFEKYAILQMHFLSFVAFDAYHVFSVAAFRRTIMYAYAVLRCEPKYLEYRTRSLEHCTKVEIFSTDSQFQFQFRCFIPKRQMVVLLGTSSEK
jgi:hypothetical protein